MKVRCLLIVVIVLFATGVLTVSSYAKIDPKTCVGMWLFDDGKGDTTADSSGNKKDGMLKNDPKWVAGKLDKALEFNGSSTYIEVPYPDEFTLETFTIMAYIKTSETAAWSGIVEKRVPGQIGNYALEMTSVNTVQFIFTKGGDQKWQIAMTKTVVNDGKWHHIVGTYDNKALRIYADGILEAQTAFTGIPDKNTQPLTIGSQHTAGGNFKGIIDEVAVFNVALGDDDIKRIMDEGLIKAASASAVSTLGKLTTAWAGIKTR